MPKTIDYPRTTYQSAWEVSEVVDDTGGKCSIETCARKLNRKVSGSFKAILGSAVKFGLLTSKRELLTTTNLFRRIKHAYDKQEEILYHREAFLHPPLFTQICRKFRNRELPVHMFDIMLIREFGVEEINAQNVSKAFVEGARMTGIIDERNMIADIDQLAAQQGPRRELASGEMPLNLFKGATATGSKPTPISTTEQTTSEESEEAQETDNDLELDSTPPSIRPPSMRPNRAFVPAPVVNRPAAPESADTDPISALFGLHGSTSPASVNNSAPAPASEVYNNTPSYTPPASEVPSIEPPVYRPTPVATPTPPAPSTTAGSPTFMIHISGPGLDTQLHIQDTDDLEIVRILLDKIRRQLT
ncbi:hypothetical protein J0X19_11340 [Hymenobacter sp. BT186]|uniref:Uncharacterized protein n=1 Tax=Hymenobacter telluris TaxID=2816474 RepID=A0A939JAW6_9BACT|nr:hypothetical protein [Hymenobacter telluris]MBO0358541.1 hypothetical protein [Hymenobacter telluris]MBW3374567.1 hypothetical protein [Hymenobacter norwichensis]